MPSNPELAGNVGLGKTSVEQLCQHNPARVYLAARSKTKFNFAIAEIQATLPEGKTTSNIEFLEIDLSSLSSVRLAAQKVLAENERLDILMNNAGVLAVPALTSDGYELQFGTNHIGHMYFTLLLLPLLTKTSSQGENDARIINISSVAHKTAPFGGILLEGDGAKLKTTMKEYALMTRYGQSKLANILLTTQLAKRYPHILSVAIHPGIVSTNIAHSVMQSKWYLALINKLMDPFLKRSTEGVKNQLWAATARKELIQNGKYYVPVGSLGGYSALAKNEKLSDELWDWTVKELEAGGWWSREQAA